MASTPEDLGPIDLLILQSTSLCNIDCGYCYLPDRAVARRMSLDVLERVLRNVAASGLLAPRPVLLWHAGEPLTVPVSWYREASSLLRSLDLGGSRFTQQFQTNGMLIDEGWCAFFQEEGARVGVSLDGPRFIHDRNRVTRRGSGTFDAVMTGLELLDRHGIEYNVLSVLDRHALDFPDEIYGFFRGLGVRWVGFNIEESVGVHASPTLEAPDTRARFTAFLRRVHELEQAGGPSVRELSEARALVSSFGASGRLAVLRNPNLHPLSILTVGYDGRATTFSPELLGVRSERYGDFHLGNLATAPVRELLESSLFRQAYEDIRAGVDLCRQTCRYFAFCGGGFPTNKLAETGTFASAETRHCLSQIQPVLDVVLESHERELGLPGAPAGCC
jgi:uncharacterized protein